MEKLRPFLGGRSAEDFLANYWQKKPLLVRGALAPQRCHINPEELLGLACESEVESRLVQHEAGTWSLTPGPFHERDLRALGTNDWTVLVSDVEEHLPEAAEPLTELDFLPSWRVDDVMASYATIGGSVGPHYDSYDVFLVQVCGTRQWQLSARFDADQLRTDTELCILSHFEAEEEWELEPGDMLYLPPHVAHFGRATSPCMTVSLGCRAPSVRELVTHVAGEVVERLDARAAYADPDLQLGEDRHRLSLDAVRRAQQALSRALALGEEELARSFGRLVTRPKALFASELALEELETEEIESVLRGNTELVRRKGSRWLYLPTDERAYLYVNELEFDCSSEASFARELCHRRTHCAEIWRRWTQNEVREAVLRDLVRWGLLEPDSGQ